MNTIVTHSGNFHTDDIFAVAALLIMYPDAQVLRSRETAVVASGDIVVDVGDIYDPQKARFDHHQPGGAGVRPNGIPYASFGLIWMEYGEKIAGSKEARDIIDERLCMSIDAIDNGVKFAEYVYPGVREFGIGDFLYSFLDPNNTDPEYLYKIFIKAVNIAKELLEREIAFAKIEADENEEVRNIINSSIDKRIIILPKAMSWGRAVDAAKDVLFIIYPRKEGTWGAKSARKNIIGFETRKPFPESWAGKSGEELIGITGVRDAMFAHKSRYLVGAVSEEGAIALAKLALQTL